METSSRPAACGPGQGSDICPTLDDCHGVLRHLMPRGRAWDALHRPGTVMWRFWRALAHLFEHVNARICAASDEFFCSTIFETRDGWMAEYGLPDACDPWPDLCAKVAAVGGTRCDYYVALAARAGWAISCDDGSEGCGAQPGCFDVGFAQPGATRGTSSLRIVVHLGASPAYQAPAAPLPQAGCLQAGQPLACGPEVSPLICLLERVVHAHVEVTFEIAPT